MYNEFGKGAFDIGSSAKKILSRAKRGTFLMVTSFSLVLGACGGGGGSDHSDGLTVNTTDGAVRGFQANGTRQFLGIPYASPPVGDLRWRPPVAAAKRSAVFNANQHGPLCAQSVTLGVFSEQGTAEDCLHANVYTPPNANSGAKLPVMVWIFGGGGITGADRHYDGTKLSRDGNTVVVTFNYRLNVFGTFAHPSIATEGHDIGNYGFMDQQFLLTWVKQNIANFGGDPDNVTIFGESNGGISVMTHLIAPGSVGLFHKGIIQSGFARFTETPAPSLATAETNSENFANAAGCAGQGAACLRALPVSALLQHGGNGIVPANLIVDGTVVPQSPYNELVAGNFNRVPLMIGSTLDEGNFFASLNPANEVLPGDYNNRMTAIYGADAPDVIARYPESNFPLPTLGITTAGTDRNNLAPTRRYALAISQFTPVYQYLFADRTAPSFTPVPAWLPLNAAHTFELQYLFPLWKGGGVATPLSAAQETLSNSMVGYWSSFARTGNPNSASNPNWPLFDNVTELVQRLDLPGPTTMNTFRTDFHCDFWDNL